MERATRHVGREAARAGLLRAALLALATACASPEAPPGGPPDAVPPVVLVISPDSGAVVPGFDDDVEFRFDEVITEANLDRFVRVSPRHEEVRVRWRRQRFTLKPRGGWYPGAVYQVSLLPGVTDLRSNRLDSGRTIVFSTGDSIPATVIQGTVIDWEAGRIGARGVVEAVALPDSVVYFTVADSAGGYALRHLPAGRYLLRGGIDGNTNDRLESREPFDSVTVDVRSDSGLTHELWAFRRDTTGPRVTAARPLDSVAIHLEFSQKLGLALPSPDSVAVWLLPDSTPVRVDRLLAKAAYDSIAQAAQARADSLRADSIAAATDSVAGDPDAAAADPAPIPAPPVDAPVDAAPDSAAAADSAAAQVVADLLAQRPRLVSDVVVVVAGPLDPDTRYFVEIAVQNLLGVAARSGRAIRTPATAPDST